MPIPAGYTEPLQTPRANRSVEATWTYVADRTGSAVVLPDGRCDVIVQFNAARHTPATAVITGPATKPYEVAHEAGDTWVGVRMRPGADAPLVRTPDGVVQGVQALALIPDLAPILDGPHDTNRIARALLALPQVACAAPCPPPLQMALDRLHLTGGRARISELATHMSVTSRHLARLFVRHIGLSPKSYGQLVRFHRAVALLKSGALTLTQTALEAGFADHAHLTRDVARFGGFSPSALPASLTQPGFLADV